MKDLVKLLEEIKEEFNHEKEHLFKKRPLEKDIHYRCGVIDAIHACQTITDLYIVEREMEKKDE